MSREYGVGPVPEADVIGEELHDFLVQLRRSYMDVGKTVQRAVAAAGGTSTSGSSTIIIDGGSGGTYTPDLTPPPTPSGVLAVAGIDFVGITTDAPTFTAGHGYGRTIVYGTKYSGTGPLPTFSSAVVVHEFVGAVGSFPTEPATQWHLWLKWRSVDGVLSSSPSGGTNGHTVTTGQDVTKLLDALSGAITRDEISADVWRTNTFAIAPPVGSPLPEVLPFIVQTSPTTLNGATIPAGVYIDSGYIRDLTAVVARMGNAWITSAMVASLAASKITAGSVAVGEHIQSSNYVAGTSGWRIHGDGTAEFGAASIRGQLVASQIDTRNLTVKDAAGNVILGAAQNLDINRLQAGVDFQPDVAWDFTGSADGWTANSATLTPGAQELYVGSTTADPNFISPVISISGARSTLIRMRVLKGAGSWEGLIFFQTAGHGFSGSYYKSIPAPPDNVWTTIEVDMSSLTVGGGDWTASTIERLRFDFFNASGATIAVDWIAIGRQGPLWITGANITSFMASAAIGWAQIGDLVINTGGGVRSGKSSYGAGTGWLLEYNSGTPRLDIGSPTKYMRWNGTDISFSGDLVAANGTFGTITAGLLRNAGSTTSVNLNATGSQDFLTAGGGAVRITADGDAFFQKVITSGTWTGSAQLVQATTDPDTSITTYSYPEVSIVIDTGVNRPAEQLEPRSLTARLGVVTTTMSPSEPAGNYAGTMELSANVARARPVFVTGASPASGQNPYGDGSERVLVRVVARLGAPDGKTSFIITSIQWTLDAVG